MAIVVLDESELKVAVREYIERNYDAFKIEYPWGLMSMSVNGERAMSAELIFSEE